MKVFNYSFTISLSSSDNEFLIFNLTSFVFQVCKTCNASGMGCSVIDSEVSPGIKGADFVFYVSALKTERCNKGLTVAYAAHCQQESALDRLEEI